MRLCNLMRGAGLDERDVATGRETLFLQRLAHGTDSRVRNWSKFLSNQLATGRIARALPGRIGLGRINAAVWFQNYAAMLDGAQNRDVAYATLPRIGPN